MYLIPPTHIPVYAGTRCPPAIPRDTWPSCVAWQMTSPTPTSTETLPWTPPAPPSSVGPTHSCTQSTHPPVTTTARYSQIISEHIFTLYLQDCGEPRSESNTCRQRSKEDPQLSINYGACSSRYKDFTTCIHATVPLEPWSTEPL